ncbi:hypothetical protein Tco_0554244 [Tanacetum coccineum]
MVLCGLSTSSYDLKHRVFIDFLVKEPCPQGHKLHLDGRGGLGEEVWVFLLELVFMLPRELMTSLGGSYESVLDRGFELLQLQSNKQVNDTFDHKVLQMGCGLDARFSNQHSSTSSFLHVLWFPMLQSDGIQDLFG